MKNIHVLPTEKPSRLFIAENDIEMFILSNKYGLGNELCQNQHIYITSDDKIKQKDRFFNTKSGAIGKHNGADILLFKEDKKIILTTDPELIKDGVQAIPDEFLEWFVKNPNCNEVEVKPLLSNNGRALFGYKIIIPEEEPKQELGVDFEMSIDDDGMSIIVPITKQETLEEVVLNSEIHNNLKSEDGTYLSFHKQSELLLNGAKLGAKWQQEQDKKMYSEEDMRESYNQGRNSINPYYGRTFENFLDMLKLKKK
jgi:hypothetical protein